ncbi:MAG: alpha/beta hydrolase [Spirochaetae bacterium HGW-Spirochaetae-1]|jgi:acetyl esterase/lipase|nr:MAG: alpha/beta hydrolase [Spirochaetae bacterium HGW-Spirochaetae-1]
METGDMASREFYRIRDSIKKIIQRFDYSGNQDDINRLRFFMNMGIQPFSDRASLSEVTAGTVPAAWIYDCDAEPKNRILFLHGGGYVAGGIISHRNLAAWISRAAGCAVLLIDYRLAPENPFPAALDDALTAYRWMQLNGPMGEESARNTFIAGDSAGGGLTLATLLALKQGGEPLPRAAVTLSAFADLSMGGETIHSLAEQEVMIPPKILPGISAAYCAGADPRDPHISPVYGDPSGLPPLLMQTGDAEILLDHTTRFAAKAKENGVDVTLEIWEEMFHDFQLYANLFSEGREAIEKIGLFVRRYII